MRRKKKSARERRGELLFDNKGGWHEVGVV